MPWGLPSSSSPNGSNDDDDKSNRGWWPMTGNNKSTASPPHSPSDNDSGNDSITSSIRGHLSVPHNWIAPVAAAGLTIGLFSFYQAYLRRFPDPSHITPSFFRRRSLFGKVTSVGDGDGFHLFHTPGGRLAGWGWLRRVPKDRKALKGRTISIRLAGVDAPEGAHFGRPAQPFAAEALSFLESLVLHRRVRAYIYKRDQYERVVATVYVRQPPFFSPRKDVGLELLKRGLATTYEGRTGAEFGGERMERRYKEVEAEAKRRGRGMWGATAAVGGKEKGFFSLLGGTVGRKKEKQEPVVVESPMEYKRRMKLLDKQKGKV
ncbi:hypothetical protein VTI74DRAFT_7217 [Chaetomium olivicolor]